MFSTKLRTTIIALVASTSFAAATIAPAVSQAQKVQPPPHKITHAEACSTLAANESKAEQELKKYSSEGDTANAELAETVANLYYEEGVREGCWLADVRGPISAPPIAVIGSGVGVLNVK
jgi:hypothetical protein